MSCTFRERKNGVCLGSLAEASNIGIGRHQPAGTSLFRRTKCNDRLILLTLLTSSDFEELKGCISDHG